MTLFSIGSCQAFGRSFHVTAPIQELMSVAVAEKSLSLQFDVEGKIPETIETDRKRVTQVLINLLGNAIKFTESGSVRVVARCLRSLDLLEITVSDTGRGIAEEDIDAVFRPFERGHRLLERSAGGTGLGLAISKRLVEKLGGSLSATSTLGKGSTFRVTIPIDRPDDVNWITPDPDAFGKSAPPSANSLSKLSAHVLIVDDRRDMRFLIQQFIESAGGTVEIAKDGKQGLEAVRASSPNKDPIDAILMDVQMPVMDGLEATRQLRERGYEGPIIALTASAMKQDRDDCLHAGCNDVVSKPIDRSVLLSTLSRLTETQFSPDVSQD